MDTDLVAANAYSRRLPSSTDVEDRCSLSGCTLAPQCGQNSNRVQKKMTNAVNEPIARAITINRESKDEGRR